MKKILSLMLVFCLMISFVANAEELSAETPEQYSCGDYTYILLDDGSAEIEMYYGSAEELIIPEKLDENPVSSIADYAFLGKTALSKVTIPDGVVHIGMNPFAKCDNLAEINISLNHPYLAIIDGVLFSKPDKRLVCYPGSIKAESYTIPNGIQVVGDRAFMGQTFLSKVTIPDSVNKVGINPFLRCTRLSEIIVSSEHTYLVAIGGVLFSKPDRRLVCYPCGYSQEDYVIPNGILTIGELAFSWNNSLRNVTIPNSVVNIEDNAFLSCSSLYEMVIPESVTNIGSQAFFSCKSLTQITIPNSVTSIGEWVFFMCDSLTASVCQNSYAEEYCKENNIKYTYMDSLDWLNN